MADGKTKIIEVPGVGNVEFPDSMSDKDIGNAIQTNSLKTGAGMEHPTDPTNATARWQKMMQTSRAPDIARGVTATLPAAGAIAGGALASPGVVTTAGGAGLGGMAGKQAELAANRALFGKEETSPLSLRGAVQTAGEGAINAIPTAAMGIAASPITSRLMQPGVVQGVAKDIAQHYAGPRLAEAILPTSEEEALSSQTSKILRNMRARAAAKEAMGIPSATSRAATPSIPVASTGNRFILSPEEVAAQERLQKLASQQASERGMRSAAWGKMGQP